MKSKVFVSQKAWGPDLILILKLNYEGPAAELLSLGFDFS